MRIDAGDIAINYDLSGPADAPVVAMSHSLASSLVMWDPQLAVLSTKYRVLRMDTRGHGLTDAPANEYTLAQLGNDAVALLDRLDIAKVHWVGLSMGGMIGQEMALNHADRLMSLAICNSSSQIPAAGRDTWTDRIKAVRESGMAAVADATVERWFTDEYRAKKPPQLEQVRMEILRTPVDGFAGCCAAIRELDFTDRLGAVKTPTLIIAGEFDPGTPLAASQVMNEKIPGSELVVLPVRHFSNVEAPDEFTRALTAFLAKH
ncbi:MAG: 3-oxoadipate enol-lactonase [Alphaproteobacteria bacterium]